MKVALLDYGRGNLRSVERALAAAGAEVTRVENPKGLPGMNCLVVPGQGSFGDAIQGLQERGLWKPLQEWIQSGKPYLGIVTGKQIGRAHV